MSKPALIFLSILTTAVFVGCQSAAQPTPTSLPATATREQPASTQTAAPTQTTPSSDLQLATCTVASLLPAPDPSADSPFLPVEADDWAQGPASAQVTIIEYSDFQ